MGVKPHFLFSFRIAPDKTPIVYTINVKVVKHLRGHDMDLGLREKVALVLAASKGLGRACATALAAEGADVTIGARNKQVVENTAQEIQRETGSRILAVPTDVTREEDIEAIVTSTVRAFGHIDILVNNAGGPPFGTFETVGDVQWQAAFELNLLSAVRLVRLVLPHMRKSIMSALAVFSQTVCVMGI